MGEKPKQNETAIIVRISKNILLPVPTWHLSTTASYANRRSDYSSTGAALAVLRVSVQS